MNSRNATLLHCLISLSLVLGCSKPQKRIAEQGGPKPSKQKAEPSALREAASPQLTVKLVNLIPLDHSDEVEQDSEPFLAVDAQHPAVMVASAFTPSAVPASQAAPLFVTTNGGDTWRLQDLLPSQRITADVTHSFWLGNLYSGIIAVPRFALAELMNDNIAAGAAMKVQATRPEVDQPFVQAGAKSQTASRPIYVSNNDNGESTGASATVDVSLDGGSSYRSVRLEHRHTVGQDAPSVRTAASGDGTVYAAYLGWRAFKGNSDHAMVTADVVVARDDNEGAGAQPFADLFDKLDSLPGTRVATGVQVPWDNPQYGEAGPLGQERIGSTLALAVSPQRSGDVYVAWADRVGDGDVYTVHVRRSDNRGVAWSTSDFRAVRNATNVALAVAENGIVGLLYQKVFNGFWETHLEEARADGARVVDLMLARVPATAPAPQFLPYIGDYACLLFVKADNSFRGVFSANNTPDLGNFPAAKPLYQRLHDFGRKRLLSPGGQEVAISIDPFYFSVQVGD